MHAFDRQTDGQTDRNLIARPRLHCMQRGKNNINVSEMTVSLLSRAVKCVFEKPGYYFYYKKTRNLSGDEIANVNFLYDDIVHTLPNTIDSCINWTIHRSTRLEHRFTKSSGIKQCNGHYVVQGHSRSPILIPFDFLLVIILNYLLSYTVFKL